jgi:uncharacterized protein YjiS (DUF1127 family)
MLSVITSVGSAALVSIPTFQSAQGHARSDTLARPKETPSAFMSHVTTVWKRFSAWKMRRATRTILSSLDDRILKDIGLQRSEINAVLFDLHERTLRWPV